LQLALLKPHVLPVQPTSLSLSLSPLPPPSIHPIHQTSSNNDAQAVLTMYADRHRPGIWHVQGVPTAKLVLHETVIESKKAFTKV
jgi:hypothetical protein